MKRVLAAALAVTAVTGSSAGSYSCNNPGFRSICRTGRPDRYGDNSVRGESTVHGDG